MSKTKIPFYQYQSLLVRVLIVTIATVLTVYLFPKSDRFKYDFEKGEPWQYETLYAPFSFSIKKSKDEINAEIEQAKNQSLKYFDLDTMVQKEVSNSIIQSLKESHNDSLYGALQDLSIKEISKAIGLFYKDPYTEDYNFIKDQKSTVVKKGNELFEIDNKTILKPEFLNIKVNELINRVDYPDRNLLKKNIIEKIKPNLFYNEEFTDKILQEDINKILPTRGRVAVNSRIIAQGEIVEGGKYQSLITLNEAYQSQTWSESQYLWKLLGYFLLVGLTFFMLMMFLYKYRPDIYKNTRKLIFIYFNVLTVILLTTLVLKIDPTYVYIIPICILPLIIKAFFDARVGLFVHVITVLILSFIVPHGQEYLFLQMIAGIITILSGSEIYKRANLFITVGQIVLIYIGAYFAFYAIHQGGVVGWEWDKLVHFILCGLAMLFVWPLIYMYEKLFGLVSDVSLLELSDTNSKLLKELSNKAPGTFHHSLNVANIAEAAANEINANAMLTRVGALYHDIGKMDNPTYFTENQGSGINPHDELDPKESARIIIDHTIKGVEIAKKNNLPDRVVDFIRTHHGDSTVYYFYKKSQEVDTHTFIDDFKYNGPKPFSKETAILMIADSVEAASKSLKNPTSIDIDQLVEKIINKQVDEGQFINADITFKHIESIKSVIKKKLASIYHLRIEYPE